MIEAIQENSIEQSQAEENAKLSDEQPSSNSD